MLRCLLQRVRWRWLGLATSGTGQPWPLPTEPPPVLLPLATPGQGPPIHQYTGAGVSGAAQVPGRGQAARLGRGFTARGGAVAGPSAKRLAKACLLAGASVSGACACLCSPWGETASSRTLARFLL